MILRYGVENFCSFREYTELSFIASAQSDQPTFVHTPEHIPERVLPVVGVYGANASGKSNLLNALLALRNHVSSSFVAHTPGAGIRRFPWRMSGETPTRLDVDFLHEGVRHHYGIRYVARGYTEEWLYRWPHRHRQMLFHRDHERNDAWHFGRELGGARKAIMEATRDNALFLSAAAQFNHPVLAGVARTLVTGIVECAMPVPNVAHYFPSDSALFDAEHEPFVRETLRAADLGVVGFRGRSTREVRREVFEHATDAEGFALMEALARVQEQGQELREVWLQHGDANQPWELPPPLESHGTRALLIRLHALIPALKRGGLLICDELESGLHPELSRSLVGLFTNRLANPKGAQLLFTTHQTELLGALRRDEVILVDKDRDGASSLRSASDFKDLRRRDDLKTVYTQGRIGGVPVLGDLAGPAARLGTEDGA